MGLFSFTKSQLLKSLEWTDNTKDTLVYKYPMDGRQIMMGSKLTVRESQAAVFVNKGKLADVFERGKSYIVVSHQTRLLSRADEIVVLSKGKIEYAGKSQDVLKNMQNTSCMKIKGANDAE